MKEPKISLFLERIGTLHLKIVKRERFRSRRSGQQINKSSKLAYRYKVTVTALFFLETKPNFPYDYVASSDKILSRNLRIPLWYARLILFDMFVRRLHFEQDTDIKANLRKRLIKTRVYPHVIRLCKICSTPFLVTTIRACTCSSECRLKYWKLKHKNKKSRLGSEPLPKSDKGKPMTEKGAIDSNPSLPTEKEDKLKKKAEKLHMTVEDLTELVLKEIV